MDGSGLSLTIVVTVGALVNWTDAVWTIATVPAKAEMLYVRTLVPVNEKVATPLPPVVACSGAKPPEGSSAAGTTLMPPIGFPRISRTVTVIVLAAPMPTLVGAATTVERSALGTPLLTAIGADVMPARLAPEKARVKLPVAPPNARSTKLARPLASVERV